MQTTNRKSASSGVAPSLYWRCVAICFFEFVVMLVPAAVIVGLVIRIVGLDASEQFVNGLVTVLLLAYFAGFAVFGGQTFFERFLNPKVSGIYLRSGLSFLLDFATAFLSLGYTFGLLSGQIRNGVFQLNGIWSLFLVAGVAVYFVVGNQVLGGTPWRRIFKVEPANRI